MSEIIRVCNHCNGTVKEVHMGDEGLSICDECDIVEGGDTEMTVEAHEKLQEES